MVKYGREQLICHPLCLKYLETKWSVNNSNKKNPNCLIIL